MRDEDMICLGDSPLSMSSANRQEEEVRIPGVPRNGALDEKKRFSFGLSLLDTEREPTNDECSKTRRSLSQPTPLSCLKDSTDQISTKPGASQLPLNGRKMKVTSPRKKVDSKRKNLTQNLPATASSFSPLCSPNSSPEKARAKGAARKVREVLVEDEFFGVYCLISRSPLKQYKNRCYIGYTVDPNRRIRQHNGGRDAGGAKKTDSRGPWDMVCIIHGFPNSVSALRFEWAWQNPEKSRVIKDQMLKKTKKETPFEFRLRIACHLIKNAPWNRLALSFRWLLPSEERAFPSEILPPPHVRTLRGLVKKTGRKVEMDRDEYEERGCCALCHSPILSLRDFVRCLDRFCACHFHMRCLAADGLAAAGEADTALFPLSGKCPKCLNEYLWGDVIREHRAVLSIDASHSDPSLHGLVPGVNVLL